MRMSETVVDTKSIKREKLGIYMPNNSILKKEPNTFGFQDTCFEKSSPIINATKILLHIIGATF